MPGHGGVSRLGENLGRGQACGSGKALDQSGQTEPVVAVAVGDVDARGPPPQRLDPVGQSVHLVMGDQRVDEIASWSP